MKRILPVSSTLSTSIVIGLICLCLAAIGGAAKAAPGQLTVTFTTTSAGGHYYPANIHVVWIEGPKPDNAFVRTILLYANVRANRFLDWDTRTDNFQDDVDARTGATVNVFREYTATWDLRYRNGTTVPDGTYDIELELTSEEDGLPRNRATFTFVKNDTPSTQTPPDQGGYRNVTIQYTPPGLGVANGEPTNVTDTSARLNGIVTGTGGENPTVYIYWGDEDHGTDAANWDHEIVIGAMGEGPFHADITDLTPGATYFFRSYAQNSTKSEWAQTTTSFKAVTSSTVFEEGSIWKYFKGTTTPPGTWKTLNFVDSEWLTGPTGIGYGDEDDATVLSDMREHYKVVYMRYAFGVASPDDVEQMTFTVDYDDAFIAYINGSQVAKLGFEGDTIPGHEAGEPVVIPLTEHISKLDAGSNVFAIEVHNVTLGSSDLSMIPELVIIGGSRQPQSNIKLNPRTLDFGEVNVGESAELTFDIENTGSLDLQIDSFTITGMDKAAYSLVSLPTLPLVLPSGQKATAGVRFSPPGAQDYNHAQVAVGSNDPDTPAALLTLSGSGGPTAPVALNAIGGVGGPCRAVALDADRVLIGQGAVLTILDTSDPSQLTPLGQVTVPGVIADIDVVGDIAYAALGAAGLAVIDLTNPASPILLDRCESAGHTRAVSATQSRLCTAEGAGGVISYDTTTPDRPIAKNTYAAAGPAAAVEIVGDLAYVLDEQSGLNIYDLAGNEATEVGLVAHWKLDEAQGTTAADSFSNKDGTVYGDTAWRPAGGKIGGALQLNGTDTYVRINGYKGITGSSPRTCTAWVKTTTLGVIINWGVNVAGGRWTMLVDSDGHLRQELGGGAIVGSTIVADGEWHHVAVVSDGTDLENVLLYVDGIQDTLSVPGSRAIDTQPADDVTIGEFITGLYFAGLIDDLRIYNRALSTDEIRDLAPPLLGVCDEIEFGSAIAVSGTRAYVADRLGGLFVVDISDPEAPALVGNEIRLAAAGRSITVSGSRAYVTSGAGIEVLDLANPDAPLSLAVITVPGNAEDLALQGSNAYIVAGAAGLSLWDVSIPAAATQLSAYTIQATPQGVAANASLGEVLAADNAGVEALNMSAPRHPEQLWASVIGQGQDIVISGSTVYIAAGSDGLQILELMSQAPPQWRGAFATDGFAVDVAVSGSTVVVADGADVYALNVAAPSSPVLLGRWDSDGRAFGVAADSTYAYVANGDGGVQVLTLADAAPVVSVETSGVAHGIAVADGLAYVADGLAGLQIFDISPLPDAPLLIGAFDTPGIATDVSIVGNRLCIADSAAGVTVVDVSVPTQPTLYARSSDMVRSLSTAVADSRIIVADDTGGLAILAAQAWPTDPPGNLNGDRIVSLPDLVYLADNWLANETMLDVRVGNINDDITVNFGDFATIAQNWLTRYVNTAGLVAYWKFDEGMGGTALDSSGNNRTGALMSMDNNDWVAGQLAYALDFDGIDDYVDIAAYTGITGSAPRTCTAWVNTTTVGVIMNWGTEVPGGRWTVVVDSLGRLRLEVGAGAIVGSTSLNDGKWHHVAVTSDGGNVNNIALYVDGQPDTPSSAGNRAINTQPSGNTTIGAFGSIYFMGLIDEVRIYDRLLSDQEIAEMAR